MTMLIHALVLSLLLSLPTATLAYALSSEWSAVAWCVLVESSIVAAACAYGEVQVANASVTGRIARAAYRPARIDRVIEHALPVPPVPPVPVAPERVRFIPVRSHASYAHNPIQHSAKMNAESPVSPPRLETRHGVNEADLRWFVSGLSTKGSHSRRKWEGRVAPSGAVVDAEYHALLVAPLITCGAITGRGERRAGSLVCTSSEILAKLGLT